MVLASGFPPIANDDQIIVVRGATATTLADGSVSVADNDFDQENDRLFVFLTRDVRRGTLSLGFDGRFRYVHAGGRQEADQFRYVLYDGTGFSAEAVVDISIVDGDPIAPQIVGQDYVSVNEDVPLTIDISALTVVDPDSSFPSDFTLEVGDGQNYSRTGTTITPIANFNGPLTVPVRVFDGDSFSNLFSLSVDVLPQNDAPFATDSPAPQEAIENDQFRFAVADFFADIDANDVLRFTAVGLPNSGNLAIDVNNGVLTGVPSGVDVRSNPYNLIVTAIDSGGLTASVQFDLRIFSANRADLSISGSVSLNPVTVGEMAQWNIDVSNLGPANLVEGELVAQWSTSGPALTLTAPQACSVTGNNSDLPLVRCTLDGLAVGANINITVQGTQDGDGDNSLIAVVVSDDPITGNNATLVGAQVVAEFSEGPTQIIGVSATDVVSGDLNGDGYKDLAVTSEQTTLFLNNGNRSVSTPGIGLGPGSGGADVVMLDWNGDSYLDVAVAGVPGAAARVYLNDGNGTFVQTVEILFANSGSILSAAGADFDRNGFDDLVVTGSANTWLLSSFGDSNYSRQALQTGAGLDVSVADMNGDEITDIIVVELAGRAVQILRNSGNGRDFASQQLQRGSVVSATGADLDGDGYTDLLLAVDGLDLNPPESRILYQRADGSFPNGVTIGASPLSKMLAGDVDGDQTIDIIALNAAGVHQYYRGEATGGFALNPQQIVSAGMRGGVLVDFNDDDSLDLIMAGRDADVVEIHANNGIGVLGLGDRRAPVIQLSGDANVVLPAGSSYEDPGATAMDDIDGDLTEAIQTSGNFNANIVGTYTLTYSVSDKANNQATAIRTIKVGVNDRTGGGGGGAISLLYMLPLLMLLLGRMHRRADVS